MNASQQREEELFDLARRMTNAVERRSFLERACDGDDALRRRIEKLLEASEEAERFFSEGQSVVRTAVGSRPPLGTHTPPTCGAGFGASVEEPIGTKIGHYVLLEKIGEGGCGVVYLAEQEEPLRRRVALKIIKLGMETKSVIARFEAERQALAMMDHPNIARVFDAGETERGSPFFIMELVRGVQITKYCDQNRLDLRERLELFIQICHAIQHAHQKGIIHRDIKPSNIMVAVHDGRPVPKVIDFGIAKATEARLSEQQLLSVYAQMIGTPGYMSPEQADLGGVDIDTRSDIYSLGVLLCELLVGRTPFSGQEQQPAKIEDLRRILRDREPPRPSVRFAGLTSAERRAIAAARQTTPRRLVAQLRADLDWVVLKALEKERDRRYETANGLGMELRRYLGNEAVMARPASWRYRLQKVVRRNRAVFLGAAAVTAALVAGLSFSTWMFLKEREAHRRAVAAEQQQARLRLAAETRERITQATLLIRQEKFAEADALVSSLRISEPSIEGAALLRALGEWHALGGRWRQATDRFETLLSINQLESSDLATMDYLEFGPALIEVGDKGGYERFRQQAVRRFAASPSPFADRIVKVCLLLPASAELLEAVLPFSTTMLESIEAADAAGDTFTAAWRSLALSLLEYRRGHYAEAVRWSQRAIDSREINAPRAATARLLLAMAYYQLGREAEARQEIAEASATVEAKFAHGLDRGSPTQGFWFDWAFARVLAREAQATLDARH